MGREHRVVLGGVLPDGVAALGGIVDALGGYEGGIPAHGVAQLVNPAHEGVAGLRVGRGADGQAIDGGKLLEAVVHVTARGLGAHAGGGVDGHGRVADGAGNLFPAGVDRGNGAGRSRIDERGEDRVGVDLRVTLGGAVEPATEAIAGLGGVDDALEEVALIVVHAGERGDGRATLGVEDERVACRPPRWRRASCSR